ncbi:outer membrane beta-barrel protein [Paracnuella aquatica]|uniref:outer membrane beta-barrel protein n=1 Tax=Paracnuella aquatica TaxID=2268757 RepID=UPI00138FA79F|nr:outer membrane beta-barrel protein [Paracnuella aquatica]
MKKTLLATALFFATATLHAQFPAMAPGSRAGAQQSIPSIGVVFGKLVDSAGKPISDASVVMLHNRLDTVTKKRKDVLVKGVTTKANGEFFFNELPLMGIKIKISATGYKPVEQAIAFQMRMPQGGGGTRPATGGGGQPDMSAISAMANNFEKDLGRITLQTDVQQLQDVTVTASSGRLRMDIDKKVFTVDKNLVSAGGTAVDVMKNVPSLNVDIDGNVTLRNQSPQIFVDGRPTTLTLEQIPADAIETVEVITNPSAKYDASGGGAGILNVVLKKNKKTGYNGTVNVGVDRRGGMNGTASLNVRQNKINASVAAFTNQMRNRNTGNTDQLLRIPGQPSYQIDQFNRGTTKGGFVFGRAGLDYFATNRLTLSLSGVLVNGKFDPSDRQYIDTSFNTGMLKSYSERQTISHREFKAKGAQGGFKYIFPTQGEELTGDFNYFSSTNDGYSRFNTDVYNQPGGIKTGERRQQLLSNGTSDQLTVQTDYVRPIGKAGKLEAGLRTQLRELSNNQGNYFMNQTTGEYVKIPSATGDYRNKDHVYAGYVSYGNQVKDFGYKLGLRGESSDYVGYLLDPTTQKENKFEVKYPISLFPSVFLSQKLKKNQEVQMSYTRRINRPFFMQIIPFIDSTDQQFWSRGNAALRPEFTNSLEVSYAKTFKGNNSFLASVYMKTSTDLITRYLDTIDIGGGVKRGINTYINANNSRSIGAEFTSQNQLKKWWDLTTNLNLYNSYINTDNILGYSQDAIWSYFAKFNSNFKLPKNYTVQFSGTYQSKTNMAVGQGGGGGFGPPGGGGAASAAQGYIKPNYGFDLAVRKTFLKQQAASVTLAVNDMFRTRVFDQYTESQYIIQNTRRRSDAPMVRLTFSFRFGQMDMSLFKRKNLKAENEGMQGAMQGM